VSALVCTVSICPFLLWQKPLKIVTFALSGIEERTAFPRNHADVGDR
jgi:hypothetical protein